MPRMSGVVKSEGAYEFQMAKEEAKSQPTTAQPPLGARLGAVPASKRRALALQVPDYVDRYHPELGKVEVDISPSGNFAAVRQIPSRKR